MNFGGFSTLSFNGVLFTPPDPADATTLWEALAASLAARDELADLAGIYLRQPPPLDPRTPIDSSYPQLVINPIDFSPLATNSRTQQWGPQLVQFSLLALDDVQTVRLGGAAYGVLAPTRGYARLVWGKGHETGRIPGWQRFRESATRVRNRNVWTFQFQYQINLAVAY